MIKKNLFKLFASLKSTHAEWVAWDLKQLTYFSRAFLFTCDKSALQYQVIVIQEIGRNKASFFNVM